MFGAGQMLMTPSLPITAFGDIIVVTINYRLSSLGFMTSGKKQILNQIHFTLKIWAMLLLEILRENVGNDNDRRSR